MCAHRWKTNNSEVIVFLTIIYKPNKQVGKEKLIKKTLLKAVVDSDRGGGDGDGNGFGGGVFDAHHFDIKMK